MISHNLRLRPGAYHKDRPRKSDCQQKTRGYALLGNSFNILNSRVSSTEFSTRSPTDLYLASRIRYLVKEQDPQNLLDGDKTIVSLFTKIRP